MFLSVADPSEIAAARRAAGEFARRQAFDEERVGAVALVVTELATNLIKHAGGGELVIGSYDDGSGSGIEVLSLDKGPGIADLGRAFEDGYSTAGSPGTGLGAIRRQARTFEIYARRGLGTAAVARIADGRAAGQRPGVVAGAVLSPYPGETVCGDGWAMAEHAGRPTVLVVDGSGHGSAAQSATALAVETFLQRRSEDPAVMVEDIHRALQSTRGAAVAVAQVDAARGAVRYVGLGNIAGALVSARNVRRMVSHNGTAGYVALRIREFTYPYEASSVIVLHSDGIGTHWDLDHYPGLATGHPSLIAGVLYRDHRRPRDDASVVAIRV